MSPFSNSFLTVPFQFIVVAKVLETLHLQLIDNFIFNFFFFILHFIFIFNYSSSVSSPFAGEPAILENPRSFHLLLICSLSIERRSFPSYSRRLEEALVRRHVLRSVAEHSPKGLEGILVPRRGRKLFVVDLLGLRLCRRRTLQCARADRFWRAIEMSRKRKCLKTG